MQTLWPDFSIFTCTYTEITTSSYHSESVQDPKTVRLPYDVTEEEIAIALESLPSINAVSVARSPSGLENGLTRRFQLKILVLRRFSAYIRSTQPSNQLFSPSINVQTISWGRGQPRIFKIHSQATYFNEAILITMSKSIADNA